jgi:putative PIN family toxin of toxin-antitoxin system
MLRVVLDTNVIVSASISDKGAPRAIAEAWRGQRFEVVTCPALATELRRALRYARIRQTYALADADIEEVLLAYQTESHMLADPAGVPEVVTDPDDNLLRALASTGSADYLVTGDRLLLAVGSHGTTSIVTPREFLTIVEAAAPD